MASASAARFGHGRNGGHHRRQLRDARACQRHRDRLQGQRRARRSTGDLRDQHLPFPLLLFARLRSLARRVRSAHLAEHCAIVGAGMSATLLMFVAVGRISNHAEQLGLNRDWLSRSTIGLALVVGLIVMMALFAIWSVYLLVRFAFAFRRAARALRREWHGDDRSVAPPPQAAT